MRAATTFRCCKSCLTEGCSGHYCHDGSLGCTDCRRCDACCECEGDVA